MNIVFCAYAHKEYYQSGHNCLTEDKQNIYLKNSYVALSSCKSYNPDIEVALVTNLELGPYWRELFGHKGILIFKVDYDTFVFDKDYPWSLAYYKLCALKYIVSQSYENIVLLDTDTYTQRTFHDIWIECQHNLLLYDISRGLYNEDYSVFCQEAQRFLDTDEYLTRWGGEFIAGNKEALEQLLDCCQMVYETMRAHDFVTINGDEFILSIAAWQMKNRVKNASAYVFRYWTAYSWHYTCSNYRSNPVCVLHCPREKNYGFIKMFRYIEKSERLPNIGLVYRCLNLDVLSYIKIEFVRKILNMIKKGR